MASSTSSSAAAAEISPSPPPPSPPPPQSSQRNPLEPEDFDRQEHEQQAAKLLGTKDLLPLQELIRGYARTKEYEFLTTLKSVARRYPKSFSYKLVQILRLQPSLQIRTEVVDLLQFTLQETPINSCILFHLRSTILNSIAVETEEHMLSSLCELIGQVAYRLYSYPLGGWDELLKYFITMICSYSNRNKMKGLMMLVEFPIEVAKNKEFWLNQGNFNVVYTKLLQYFCLEDSKLNKLAYNGSISLMLLSKDLQRTDVSEIFLPKLLNFIIQHRKDEGLVSTLKRLLDLLMLDDGSIFRGKQRQVFWCMIQLAELEDSSDELRNKAVNIINELERNSVSAIEGVIKHLSQEEITRVVAVAINMMACIVDDPLWSNVYDDDCKSVGFTENFNLGKFLFNLLCSYGHQSVFIPTVIDMLKEKYAYHSRWQIRHAAMFAVGYIATNNFNAGMGMVNYFEKVAILVLNCLDETNNRVLWAAMHSIILLAECTQVLMHTQYDKKFLEKLAPITKRYTCGRVQSYAVITVRLLEKTCGLDMDTDAPEFTALQDSNVANHQNDLTIKLDALENELNAENNCLALSQRIILSAAEVNDILHGATEK